MSAGAWSGGKDAGASVYHGDEYRRVVAYLAEQDCPERARLVEELARLTRLESRTVRAIISDADGAIGVVAFTERNAVYLAQSAEEAERYTRKLEAQIATMASRVARRQRATIRLPRAQGRLFP
jgi:hypothetical protein